MPINEASETAHESSLKGVYSADEEILSTLQTRKELRAGSGLVRLKPSEAEARQLVLETLWANSGDESEDADMDDDENSAEDDDEDLEDINSDQESVDDSEPELPTSKRKRGTVKDTTLTPQPIKKVAFANEPKDTKQARKAAGIRGSLSMKAKPESVKAAKKPKVAKVQPTSKTVPTKKAANAPSNKSAVPANDGGEGYDFKMFF
jgi:nuclear GTP-binding protein